MAAVIGNREISLGVMGGTLITAACYGGGEVFGVTPYDKATTRYLKATYPSYWAQIRDYGFANPQLVPWINEDRDIAVSLIKPEFVAVQQAGLLTFKYLQDGSLWLQLLHHHIKNGTQKFNNATDAEYRVDAELFSILKFIGDFQRDGKYEFLAEEYLTEGATAHTDHRWSQTSNPMDLQSISGFVNISNAQKGLCTCPSNTRLAWTNSSSNWFAATGCYTYYQGGIPSYYSSANKGTLDLWIRLKTHTTD